MSAYHDIGVRASLRRLHDMMSVARQRQLRLVVVLMLASAIAEIATIGAVLPFLAVLSDPASARAVPFFASVLAILGIGSDAGMIAFAATIFGIAAISAAAIRLWLNWTNQSFVFTLGHDIVTEIQRRVLGQDYGYHVATNTSATLATLEKTQILVSSVLMNVMQAGTATVIATLIVGVMLWLNPLVAGASALTFGTLYVGITLTMRRRLHATSRTIAAAYNDRIRITQESLGGIRDIIIDQSREMFLNEFAASDRRLQRARTMTAFIGAAPRFVIEAVGMILIAVLALLLSRDGGLQAALPLLGALALGAQRLLPLLQQIFLGWSAVAGNRATMGDIIELLDLPLVDEKDRDTAPLPFAHEIRFSDLSFRYPARAEPALEAINFSIPRGSRVALIGETGSGKSTFVDLLMGLLDPTGGGLTIDGQPLTGATRRAWQRTIAHVPQSIFLADTSIARNIAFSSATGPMSEERVIHAARTAQLHDFITSLPEGYATKVGERGVRLSGGQRQRLGIARALYKYAPVLILDEATSALDDATEAKLMRALYAHSAAGLTVIMIAHRLTSVIDCDIVVRLERGRIAEIRQLTNVANRQSPDHLMTKI